MIWLLPRFPMRAMPELMIRAVAGALIAGGYGIVHDQVTFTLSPEYFTAFKFEQFAYADFGWGERVFVAAIGFLATWWVGLIAGWILARLAVSPKGRLLPRREVLSRFLVMVVVAAVFGVAGYGYGTWKASQPGAAGMDWVIPGLRDEGGFVRVGYVHFFGYLGSLAGLTLGVVLIRRDVRRLGDG